MGLTPSDVMKAVQSQNKQSAIGSIGAEPSSDRPAFVFSLTTQGRLVTEDEFNDIVVRTGDSGAVVRIRDIGRAEMGSYLYSSTSHYNGKGAALIGVYQLPDANAFEVAQRVREEIERLSPMLPPGVTHEVAYDTTLFVQASLDELIKTLVEAAVLVLIVIFVFLQDWRATLIQMVAIPVSIVGTFAVMAAFGFSINSLTLLGLVLAIGLVVDDAIIVVENVYHQVENGEKDMREAAVKAMAQVTGPIVATSLVLLAVFIPAALMPGMTGQLYNQFALTIAFSIVLSAVNSLTLSPALSAVFLKPGHGPTTFPPFVLFNRFFDWLREKYGTVIHWFGVHWYIVAGVFVAAVAAIAVMLARTPTAFIPNEDQGYYFIGVQLPPGASLPRTVAVSETARRIAASDESVVNVLQIEGFNFLTGTQQTNAAFLIVVLHPWEERDPRTQNARAIIVRALPKLREIPEANCFPVPPPPIQGLGAAGGFQLQLEDAQGVGFAEFSQVAKDFLAAAQKRPEDAAGRGGTAHKKQPGGEALARRRRVLLSLTLGS
jgi:hydrophobe/amphiphile efflux-1 (HAE1) family protein